MEAEIDASSTLLRGSLFFRSLEGAEINRLVELPEIQEYSPGETVVVEGSMGDAIFLLYDGELSIHTRRYRRSRYNAGASE
jgi:CRP-like cAMP-binding protein